MTGHFHNRHVVAAAHKGAIQTQRIFVLGAQSANLVLIIILLERLQLIFDLLGIVDHGRNELADPLLVFLGELLVLHYNTDKEL